MSSAVRMGVFAVAALTAWPALLWSRPSPAPPEAAAATAPSSSNSASAAPAPTEGDFLAVQRRYLALLEQARLAVVKINVVRRETPDALPTVYACTGFFISRDGSILTTNAHLLAGAERVWFEHQGVSYHAEVAGTDLVSNVALLRAPRMPKEFAVLNLADSTALPPVGAQLLAVTSQLGEDPGPSPGLVQGYNTNYGERPLPTLHLRTNIPYDGGEGGSPVFDLEGRLIGLLVVALPETRSSLVLPARAALRVREDLLTNGRVHYGRFGFQTNQLAEADSGSRVLVSQVEYGGPAAAAGLRNGDVLISIGGQPVRRDLDLRQIAFFSRPGQYVTVKVRRVDEEMEFPLFVAEMSAGAAPTLPVQTPLAGTAPAPGPIPISDNLPVTGPDRK